MLHISTNQCFSEDKVFYIYFLRNSEIPAVAKLTSSESAGRSQFELSDIPGPSCSAAQTQPSILWSLDRERGAERVRVRLHVSEVFSRNGCNN